MGKTHVHDGLEDGLPVEVDLGLVELDVHGAQPLLCQRSKLLLYFWHLEILCRSWKQVRSMRC